MGPKKIPTPRSSSNFVPQVRPTHTPFPQMTAFQRASLNNSFPGTGIASGTASGSTPIDASYEAYRAELAALRRIAAEEMAHMMRTMPSKKATTARGRPRTTKSLPSELKQKQLQQQQAKKNQILQMGPFFLWLNENRDKLEKENPNLVGTYLIIKAGQKWHGLNPYERQEYEAKVQRAPAAFITSLIEIGEEDFAEEFQDAKATYDFHHAGKI